jgi:hypothetical protein
MNLTVKPQYALFAPNTSKQLFMIHPNANTYASHAPPTYPPTTQLQPGAVPSHPYHPKQMDDVMSQQHHHHQVRQQQQQQQQQAAAAMMASAAALQPAMHYSGQHGMNETAPSITDHGLQPVNIPQLAEFASSMVFLMWHARRPSVLALYNSPTSTTSPVGTPPSNASPTGAGATASGQHRQAISIGNSASPAFKKFCLQVSVWMLLTKAYIPSFK